MITAVVRTTSLEHIVQKLEQLGIRNLTISEIKGIGEEVPLFKPYTIHDRIEIIVSDDKADEKTTFN
jgi:nitrogen regulatory protein PII